MKRIMIIGASGAGKSTLARALGKSLALPVHHIDTMYFTKGWVQRPREEIEALIRQAAREKCWIIEGNSSRTFDERAEVADLIVALELGRKHRLRRTLWQSLRYYGRTRPDMAQDCPERFDWAFHFDWVWNYDRHSKHKYKDFLSRWAGRKPILRLSSAREMHRFGRDPMLVLIEKGQVDPVTTSS